MRTVSVQQRPGWGYEGRLGTGDNNYRGDSANEMGDYLDPIDLGSGFEIERVYVACHSVCGMYPVVCSIFFDPLSHALISRLAVCR